MGISKYLVIIVSVIVFLIPMSQAEGLLLIPIEVGEEYFVIIYKEIQEEKAEKFRDYYLQEFLRLQNPYDEEIYDSKTVLNEKEVNFLKSIHRDDKNFQTIKDEQLSLAEKKYQELLGGKSITNTFVDETENDRKVTSEFVKAIHRDDDGFETYKIKQKIFAERTISELIDKGVWEEDPFVTTELFEDYYYESDSIQDIKSVTAALELIEDDVITAEELIEDDVITAKDLIQDNVISADNLQAFWKGYEIKQNEKADVVQKPIVTQENNDFDWDDYEWKKLYRGSEEFQNLISDQISLAEQVMDENVEFREIIMINDEKNKITSTLNELERQPIILREDKNFQLSKLKEIEKAESIFSDYYHIKSFDEDKINDELIEDTTFIIPKVDDRSDMFFKLLKEFEKEKAEEKMLEILGGKRINS